MIRFRSRRTRSALDHIQAAHLPRVRITTSREISRIAGLARESGGEKVRVQRDNHIGSIELVNRLDRLTESHLCARINIVAIHRFVNMPSGLRVELENRVELVCERG